MDRFGHLQRRPPRLAMLAAFITVTAVSAHTASARQLGELRYQVAWGNLTLAEAKVNYALEEEGYEIEGSGESQGTLAFLFPWKGSARTVGVTTSEGFEVMRHESEGRYKNRTRRTTVQWTAGSPLPELKAEPQSDLSEVTPVPPGATAGTSDPFTVLLRILDRLERGGRCEAEERVWDGRRRYDLKIEHIERTELAQDRPWAYGGPAIGCRMIYKRIGGFRRESDGDDQQNESSRTVWIGRPGGDRLAPVRIELEAPIGHFVARLYAR
jgi:hypothetical protein